MMSSYFVLLHIFILLIHRIICILKSHLGLKLWYNSFVRLLLWYGIKLLIILRYISIIFKRLVILTKLILSV